jgi:hypothetical protein
MHGVLQQNNARLELGIQHYYARTSCTNPVLKKSMCSSIKMSGDKRPYNDISTEQESATALLSAQDANPPHPTGATTPQGASDATTPQDAGGRCGEAAVASPEDAMNSKSYVVT